MLSFLAPSTDLIEQPSFVEGVKSVIQQSRSPFAAPSIIASQFNKAVEAYQSTHDVCLRSAFLQVARQTAWQASSFDFSAQLLRQREAYLKQRKGWLDIIPSVDSLLDRQIALPDGDTVSTSLCTDEQKQLMDIDPQCAESSKKVFDLMAGWRLQHKVSALQRVIGEASKKYEGLPHSWFLDFNR